MIAILSLLLVVTLSILITRVASIALTHAGLARQSARFARERAEHPRYAQRPGTR
jgi:hypothetical protein